MERLQVILLSASANLVALLHLGYFFFVLGGAVAIPLGPVKDWGWVHRPWFRIPHLLAVYIVLFEEVTGIPCVLNLFQWALRRAASGEQQATEGAGGVLDYLLYGTIPPLALDVFYWSMGLLVLIYLWKIPVRFQRQVDAIGDV